MNKIDDENIRKIIKNNVEEPKIMLTSHEILARFEAQKKHSVNKKSLFSFPALKIALSFVTTSLVVGAFIYLTKNIVAPPITSETSSTSDSLPIDRESAKIPGGKEGEFVFMSFSATTFTNSTTTSPRLIYSRYNDDADKGGDTSQIDHEVIEGVLDQTLPLVDDFYAIDKEFNYQKFEGSFVGAFGSYTTKFVVDDTIFILGNVDFEEDNQETEMEIEGEIQMASKTYRYSGSSEFDASDNESDISLKIEYNENSYLEIQSENQGKKQEFSYKLVENDSEVFVLEIETFRHGSKDIRYVETNVEIDNKEYNFIIGLEGELYYINYDSSLVTVTKNPDGGYIYSY